MNEQYPIRPATVRDADAILAVYAPYVRDTCVSFETEVPAPDAFRERVSRITAAYPYFVCEHNGVVVGYAYAAPFSARGAYRFSVELSVYIAPAYHRQGIGRALYESLFDALRARGVCTAYAGITVPNEQSVGLHAALGFHPVGTYRNVGYKLGAWRDVLWLEKPLRGYDVPPAEPRLAKRGGAH